MASPRELSPLHHPLFLVLEGLVHIQMTEYYDVLRTGQFVSFERHGRFEVEHTGDTYGIIRHTAMNGHIAPVYIPPQKGCLISNGDWNFFEVNYQSYLDTLSKSYLIISIHGRQCGKLSDSDSIIGSPIGPFYNTQERESWQKRFEGQFHAMQARNGSILSVGELYVLCEPADHIPQLSSDLLSSQKTTPESYILRLQTRLYPRR